MPLHIEQSGDLDRCHGLTTLKNRATQLLIKYKSGALVTQWMILVTNCSYVSYHPTNGGGVQQCNASLWLLWRPAIVSTYKMICCLKTATYQKDDIERMRYTSLPVVMMNSWDREKNTLFLVACPSFIGILTINLFNQPFHECRWPILQQQKSPDPLFWF